MTAPRILHGLADVAADYDVILSDVWGVIHNGREHFPAPCEALSRFAAERGPVVLVSNSPRPAGDFAAQLDQLKVPRSAWQGFVTSGVATRAELVARAPGPAFRLGPPRDDVLYEDLGLTLTDRIEDAAFISCTGLFDDTRETPDDYRDLLSKAADAGLEMVCANPDRVVHRGTDLIFCSGALAEVHQALGGRVVMAGKPFAPIYALALLEAERLLGRSVDRTRVLCIGDGIPTDVLGANRQNLDLLFVAGGIHGAETRGSDGRMDAAATQALLSENTAFARHAMLDLSW